MSELSAIASGCISLNKSRIQTTDTANNLTFTDQDKQIDWLRKRVRELERSANFDPLTKLANRKYFVDRAAAEFRRTRRYNHPCSLIIVQIVSPFAQPNTQPDEELQEQLVLLSQILTSTSRDGIDICGRINPTELALLLPETNLTGALIMDDRLRTMIGRSPAASKFGEIHIAIRTGVETVQEHDRSILETLARASEFFPKVNSKQD